MDIAIILANVENKEATMAKYLVSLNHDIASGRIITLCWVSWHGAYSHKSGELIEEEETHGLDIIHVLQHEN